MMEPGLLPRKLENLSTEKLMSTHDDVIMI
jgi:hypothetical protein